MTHGWQGEATDGPKGARGLISFSLFLAIYLQKGVPCCFVRAFGLVTPHFVAGFFCCRQLFLPVEENQYEKTP